MTDYERELFSEVTKLRAQLKRVNDYADLVQRQATHAVGALHSIRALDMRGNNNAWVIADLALDTIAKLK